MSERQLDSDSDEIGIAIALLSEMERHYSLLLFTEHSSEKEIK